MTRTKNTLRCKTCRGRMWDAWDGLCEMCMFDFEIHEGHAFEALMDLFFSDDDFWEFD